MNMERLPDCLLRAVMTVIIVPIGFLIINALTTSVDARSTYLISTPTFVTAMTMLPFIVGIGAIIWILQPLFSFPEPTQQQGITRKFWG